MPKAISEPGVVVAGDELAERRAGRAGQVGRAAHQLGHERVQCLEAGLRRLAGRPRRFAGHAVERLGEAVGQDMGLGPQELRRGLGLGSLEGVELLLPRRVRVGAGLGQGRAVGLHLVRDDEGVVLPAFEPLRLGEHLWTERRAVGLRRALDAGGAPADDGADGEEAGPRIVLGAGDGLVDRVDVHAVDDALGVPAVRGEPGQLVVAGRPVGGAVDGDRVVVPQDDQAAEARDGRPRTRPRG